MNIGTRRASVPPANPVDVEWFSYSALSVDR
jgi:hypothetical protein